MGASYAATIPPVLLLQAPAPQVASQLDFSVLKPGHHLKGSQVPPLHFKIDDRVSNFPTLLGSFQILFAIVPDDHLLLSVCVCVCGRGAVVSGGTCQLSMAPALRTVDREILRMAASSEGRPTVSGHLT